MNWQQCFGTIWSNSTKEISSPVPRNFVPEDCKQRWMSREQFQVPDFDKDITKENNNLETCQPLTFIALGTHTEL